MIQTVLAKNDKQNWRKLKPIKTQKQDYNWFDKLLKLEKKVFVENFYFLVLII